VNKLNQARSLRRAIAAVASMLLVLHASPVKAQQAQQQAPATIKLLVGYSAGGGADLVARALADSLQTRLKTTVIVENRPGAGGALAAQALKAAPADGSTFMVTSDQFLITPMTLQSAGYDALHDFQPVAGVSTFDICLAVNASVVNARTLKDYLALAAKDAKLASYGVPAHGSLPQFYGYVAGKSAGVALQPVPYRGGVPMMVDLVAGHVPAAVGPCREMMEPYKSGKVRFLASVQKVGWAPEVPTFADSGIDVGPSNWQAVFASAKVPAAQIDLVQNAIRDALAETGLRDRIASAGFVPQFFPRKQVIQMSTEATRLWSVRIRESGFVAQ
jgi:tripartite-type tricarboxylate transporter receptor subunit TctC